MAAGESKPACSFCGKTPAAGEPLIRGKEASICAECIEALHKKEILDRQQEQMLDSSDDA